MHYSFFWVGCAVLEKSTYPYRRVRNGTASVWQQEIEIMTGSVQQSHHRAASCGVLGLGAFMALGAFFFVPVSGVDSAPKHAFRGPMVVVTGFVRDEAGVPIQGALVSVRAMPIRTSTGPDGLYALTLPDMEGTMIVAAAPGRYNHGRGYTGSASMDFILGDTPTVDHPTYAFLDPSTCAICHSEQVEEWTGSPMANAGLNTWVHDLYSGDGTPGGMGGFVYLRDSVFAESNPASECASCHQPEPWIETPFSAMQTPSDAGYPSIGAVHGVSCETCHKIADVDESKIDFPGIFPGAVEYFRPGPGEQIMYGSLADTAYDAPGLMRAAYSPQLTAAACGACHQDKNDPNEDHTYTGITSEPTYTEWVESPYGDPNSPYYATCVDCHMGNSGASTFCSVDPIERDPATIGAHDIRGTTPEYLENAVELVTTADRSPGGVTVDVEVRNTMTGHHVPTGVTVRNMILLVEATRASDGSPLVFDSGPVVHSLGGVGDPAQGYYAGQPGRLFAKFIRDANGNGPTFFTDAAELVFDTRLPALATDASSYVFDVPRGAGDISIRARLIYRRAFRALVDAKQWTEDGHGNPLADLQAPHFGHLKEITEFTVTGPDCLPDIAEPFGVLDLADIQVFIATFRSGDPAADLAKPFGVFDLADLQTFVSGFLGGCP